MSQRENTIRADLEAAMKRLNEQADLHAELAEQATSTERAIAVLNAATAAAFRSAAQTILVILAHYTEPES